MPGVNAEFTHQFVSAKGDGPDTTLVRPSNWNAQLNLGAGSGGHRLIRDPSQARGGAWVEPATVRLTNRTGGAHTVGDVVVLDSANDSSVAASATLNSLKKALVAMETNADAAAGVYAADGPISAKSTGAIARHQYVRLSATTGAVEDAGSAMTTGTPAPLGAVGVALAAAVGGFCLIYLFASTVGGPPVTLGYVKGTGTGYTTQTAPIPRGDIAQGTPASGKYPDGGTDPATWTALPTPVLEKSGGSVTVANTVTETSIFSFSVPGNTIGANGKLRLTILARVSIASAGSYTIRAKFGGTTMVSITTITPFNSSTNQIVNILFEVANLASTSSQEGQVLLNSKTARNDTITQAAIGTPAGGAGGAIQEFTHSERGGATIDTTAAATIDVTIQWNAATADKSFTKGHAALELVA